MPALTEAVNATARLFPTDTVEPAPGLYLIDSELVRVGGSQLTGAVGGERTVWIVERGYAGTTAASHNSGAALARHYPDAPGAGGGGDSATQLLGPFTVNYNDPGVGDDFVSVAALPAGAIVIDAWAFVPTAFTSDPAPTQPDTHQFLISLGPNTGLIRSYALADAASSVGMEPGRLALTEAGGIEIVQPGASLSVELYPAAGVFTAGVAEVYALIVEP